MLKELKQIQTRARQKNFFCTTHLKKSKQAAHKSGLYILTKIYLKDQGYLSALPIKMFIEPMKALHSKQSLFRLLQMWQLPPTMP